MTTEWVLAIQEERADEWIREYLEDDEADEESDEWGDAAKAYNDLQDHLAEEAEQEELYIQYLAENPHQKMFDEFKCELEYLNNFLLGAEKIMFQKERTYKLVYVHLVTLLESYLGDTLKSLVIHDESLLLRVIKNVKEFKVSKFGYVEMIGNENIVQTLALKQLSKIMYHNIPKVAEIYKAALGIPLNIDQKKINKITLVRHDLVHRNGKNLTGERMFLDKRDVEQAISDVMEFVDKVNNHVTSSLIKRKIEE